MIENEEPGTQQSTPDTPPAAVLPPVSEPTPPVVEAQEKAPSPNAEAAPASKTPTRRRTPARPKAKAEAAPVEAKPAAAKAAGRTSSRRKPPVAAAKAEPAPSAADVVTAPAPAKPVKKAASPKKAATPKIAKDEAKGDKKEKDKKEKVVRDSFSMPKSEQAAIKHLRTEIARAGRIVTKSEILRAGLKALVDQGAAKVVGLIEALPPVPKGKAKKS